MKKREEGINIYYTTAMDNTLVMQIGDFVCLSVFKGNHGEEELSEK